MSTSSKRRKPPKLDLHGKTVLSALSFVALLGGWNAIGHLEATTNEAAEPTAKTTPGPMLQASPSPWPTLSAQTIAPLSTLPPDAGVDVATNLGFDDGNTIGSIVTLPTLTELAPLPALEPLPGMPTMPVAPVTSRGGQSSSNGSSSSSHKSGGS